MKRSYDHGLALNVAYPSDHNVGGGGGERKGMLVSIGSFALIFRWSAVLLVSPDEGEKKGKRKKGGGEGGRETWTWLSPFCTIAICSSHRRFLGDGAKTKEGEGERIRR